MTTKTKKAKKLDARERDVARRELVLKFVMLHEAAQSLRADVEEAWLAGVITDIEQRLATQACEIAEDELEVTVRPKPVLPKRRGVPAVVERRPVFRADWSYDVRR